jgi:hypothetical protein
MPIRDISEICEIASRLNEDASTLRSLGLNDAARFLELAEGVLDSRVYAKMSNGDSVVSKARRPGRTKEREVHPH